MKRQSKDQLCTATALISTDVAKNCAETDEQRIARRGEGKEKN